MTDISNRFDLLIFEDAEAYNKRKEEEREILHQEAEKYKRIVEKKGVCEGCEKASKYLRWVHNDEFYLCYDCFIHDLQCQADVMVPMHRCRDMEEYTNESIWDELSEEERKNE